MVCCGPVLGLGVGAVALNHSNSIEQNTQTAVKQATDSLNQRLAKEDEINQQLQSDLKVVTDKLNLTQTQLIAARKSNKATSVTVDKKLTGLESSMNAKLDTKASTDDLSKLGNPLLHPQALRDVFGYCDPMRVPSGGIRN